MVISGMGRKLFRYRRPQKILSIRSDFISVSPYVSRRRSYDSGDLHYESRYRRWNTGTTFHRSRFRGLTSTVSSFCRDPTTGIVRTSAE